MNTLVTNAEIEEVGESLILKYTSGLKHPPMCIDIEGFITDFLHLPLVYADIAEEDRDKIGFVSDGKYPLKIWRDHRVECVVYPKGTVVIDRFLLQPDKSGQRRFTLAHEAAHILFERMSPTAIGPCFNRLYDRERTYSIEELRQHLTLCEAQTDRMASVLLMPQFLMRKVMKKFCGEQPIFLYGNAVLRSEDKLTIQNMANCVGVTFTAFLIRLKELNLMERRGMSEYIEREMTF